MHAVKAWIWAGEQAGNRMPKTKRRSQKEQTREGPVDGVGRMPLTAGIEPTTAHPGFRGRTGVQPITLLLTASSLKCLSFQGLSILGGILPLLRAHPFAFPSKSDDRCKSVGLLTLRGFQATGTTLA